MMKCLLSLLCLASSSLFGQSVLALEPPSASSPQPPATPARVTTDAQIEVFTSPQDSTAIAASWQAATRHRLAFTAAFQPLNLSRGIYTAAEYCALVRESVEAVGMEIYSVTDSLDYVRRKKTAEFKGSDLNGGFTAARRVLDDQGEVVEGGNHGPIKDGPVIEIVAEIGSVTLGRTHAAGLDILNALDDFRSSNVAGGGGWFLGASQSVNASGSYVSANAQPLSRYLKLLDQDSDYHSISRPKMQCVSGETASISTGSRVAVPSTTLTANLGTPSTSSTITYQNVALSLEVTPTLLDSGRVSLAIKQTDNSISGTQIISGNSVPTIASQTFSTRTVVSSGQLIALGGIRINKDNKIHKGPRGLSRLPVIGRFFRVDSGDSSDSELLIMLSVRVLK